MKVTGKGQVTIPKKLRDEFGLQPETEVVFEATDGGVLIKPALSRAREIRERLVRATGSATIPTTTDEVMRLTRDDDS